MDGDFGPYPLPADGTAPAGTARDLKKAADACRRLRRAPPGSSHSEAVREVAETLLAGMNGSAGAAQSDRERRVRFAVLWKGLLKHSRGNGDLVAGLAGTVEPVTQHLAKIAQSKRGTAERSHDVLTEILGLAAGTVLEARVPETAIVVAGKGFNVPAWERTLQRAEHAAKREEAEARGQHPAQLRESALRQKANNPRRRRWQREIDYQKLLASREGKEPRRPAAALLNSPAKSRVPGQAETPRDSINFHGPRYADQIGSVVDHILRDRTRLPQVASLIRAVARNPAMMTAVDQRSVQITNRLARAVGKGALAVQPMMETLGILEHFPIRLHTPSF